MGKPVCGKRCVVDHPSKETGLAEMVACHAWNGAKKMRGARGGVKAIRQAPKPVRERHKRLWRCLKIGPSMAHDFADDGLLGSEDAIDYGEPRAIAIRLLTGENVPERCATCMTNRIFEGFDPDDDADD